MTKYRDNLLKYLGEIDIQTLIHYPLPPHKQVCYTEYHYLNFPVAERIHNQELSLPISPVMEIEEAMRVVDALNNWNE